MDAGAVGLGLLVNIQRACGSTLSGIRYQISKNSLSAERNWMQLDINYILNADNRFFIRGWVVYEPPYRFEYEGKPSEPGLRHVRLLRPV